MGPIADYDLGRAHGKIVLEYDDKGAKASQKDMESLEGHAKALIGMLGRLTTAISSNSRSFGESAGQYSKTFAIMAGGSAILLGLSRATGTLAGGIFALRGSSGILGALSLTLGGLPKSVQGFPNIIKQIILLSSAITIFAGSSKLLNSVFVAIGRFVGSTAIVQRLAATFPSLAGQLQRLAGFIPSIRQVGESVDRLGDPIHRIARIALGIGVLISTVRSGVKVAFALAAGILKIGAGSFAILGVVKVVGILLAALKEMLGVVGVLPGALVAFGIAAITLQVGLKGIKEGIKALGEDTEKFEKAIANLAPAAQQTLREVRTLIPALKEMQKAVQERLFQDLAGDVKDLGAKYIPVLRNGLVLVAGELNGIVREFAGFLGTEKTIADINTLFQLTAQWLSNLKASVQPFLTGLLNIAVVATQAFTNLTDGSAMFAQSFADITTRMREDGSMLAWIENGIAGFKLFIGLLVSVGQSLGIIFDAFSGEEGGNVLLTLNLAADAVRDFLKSAEGQDILHTLVDTLTVLSDMFKNVLGTAIVELLPILKELQPVLVEIANAIGDTLVGAIKILAPIIRGVAEVLHDLGPVLGPIVGFFLGLGIAGKALMFIIGPIIGGVKLLVGVFTLFRTAITIVTTAWKILQFVFAVSPWTIIIAAVILLVILIIANWDKISEFLGKVWAWIKETAEKVWNSITEFFTGIWDAVVDAFKTAWDWILDFLKGVWDAIVWVFMNFSVPGLIIQYWDEIVAFTKGAWNKIVDFLSGIWNSIVEATRFIWEPIVEIFKSIWNIVYDVFTTWIFVIYKFFKDMFESLVALGKLIWEGFLAWITDIWNRFVIGIHMIFDPIIEWWNGFWGGISDAATTAWTLFTDWFQQKLDAFVEYWNSVITVASDWWSGIWDSISGVASDAWNAITEKVMWGVNLAVQAFHELFDPIIGWWNDLWNSINSTISDGVNAIKDWFGSLPGKILGALGDVWNLLADAGRAIIQGFLNGLQEKWKAVENFVGGVTDWIKANKGPIPYDRRLLIPAGEAIIGGLLVGLESKRSVIIGFMQGLTTQIANGIDVAGKEIASASSALSTSTNVGVITNAASAVTDPATGLAAPTAPATAVASGGSAGGTVVNIEKVEVPINSNLDPTDPVAWRKTMVAVKDGIASVDKESA